MIGIIIDVNDDNSGQPLTELKLDFVHMIGHLEHQV